MESWVCQHRGTAITLGFGSCSFRDTHKIYLEITAPHFLPELWEEKLCWTCGSADEECPHAEENCPLVTGLVCGCQHC